MKPVVAAQALRPYQNLHVVHAHLPHRLGEACTTAPVRLHLAVGVLVPPHLPDEDRLHIHAPLVIAIAVQLALIIPHVGIPLLLPVQLTGALASARPVADEPPNLPLVAPRQLFVAQLPEHHPLRDLVHHLVHRPGVGACRLALLDVDVHHPILLDVAAHRPVLPLGVHVQTPTPACR